MCALGSPGDVVELVRTGYDAAAGSYDAWSGMRTDTRRSLVDAAFGKSLAEGVCVDLGCGGGLGLQYLGSFGHVVGVDISRAQLLLARRRVPLAKLIQADLRSVAFHRDSLAAVVCLYSLFHIPRDLHGAVLAAVASWLKPGGRLLLNVGAGDNPGAIDPAWLGVPMYWSNWDPVITESLVHRAGLRPTWSEVIDEGDERHFWLVAAKPESK